MKITTKLLKSACDGSLGPRKTLDLNSLDIVIIESLDECTELLYLNLRGNNIQFVCNLQPCRNIWHLNLSCNKVCHLEGLECFIALGTLDLSHNELDWRELEKIQHLIVIDLRLSGNQNLQKETCYRQHVIDCLPKVWMLDGLLVTSSESLQVEQFFQESELTPHPVRRKLPKKSQGTCFGHNNGAGVYGREACEFLLQFSASEPRNNDSDKNRLKYIATHLEKRIRLEQKKPSRKELKEGLQENILQELFESRTFDKVESHLCNMLVVLLYVIVKFNLPQKLLELALEHLNIIQIGKISQAKLLQASEQEKLAIVCLLLNCEKLERDMNAEGDLYDELYLALCNSLPEILSPSLKSHTANKTACQRQRLAMELVSADVLQVMCTFPGFYYTFMSESGVRKLMVTATGQKGIVSKLACLSTDLESEAHDKKEIEELISSEIEKVCQRRFAALSSHIAGSLSSNEIFLMTIHRALPRRPISNVLRASDFHTRGLTCPQIGPSLVDAVKIKSRALQGRTGKAPELGDEVLLAPQTYGRIMSIPEITKCLVQVYSLPEEFSSGKDKNSSSLMSTSRKRYLYLNLRSMEWDGNAGYWKPKGTQGDRVTLKPIAEQFDINLTNHPTMKLLVPCGDLQRDKIKDELLQAAHSSKKSTDAKSSKRKTKSLTARDALSSKDHSEPKSRSKAPINPLHEGLRVEPSGERRIRPEVQSEEAAAPPPTAVFITELPLQHARLINP